MNLDYLSLRLVRHFMPRALVHFMLRHNLIIRPGFETREPNERINRYQAVLELFGRSLLGQRILNFGYGGNFALACGLLEAGASQVTLIDKFAPPDNHFNRDLLPKYDRYLLIENGQVLPRPEHIELIEADIHDIATQGLIQPFDIVLSSSVYEHLDDVEGITRSLVMLTKHSGCHIHFVDLRDHYFKYPFEMLTYSAQTWKKWLNPGSNLNRFRTKDYQSVFESFFEDVRMVVLERDLKNFKRAASRIDPQFLTGDPELDSVTLLQIYSAAPRRVEQMDEILK